MGPKGTSVPTPLKWPTLQHKSGPSTSTRQVRHPAQALSNGATTGIRGGHRSLVLRRKGRRFAEWHCVGCSYYLINPPFYCVGNVGQLSWSGCLLSFLIQQEWRAPRVGHWIHQRRGPALQVLHVSNPHAATDTQQSRPPSPPLKHAVRCCSVCALECG